MWACLRPFALINIYITINLYTYTIALQACSRVRVCAMCIDRLGTPLILQKHANFQNRFGEC